MQAHMVVWVLDAYQAEAWKEMNQDPVCGMRVDEEDAAARTEYGGKIYFFCSIPCQKKFQENPERFAEQRA